MKARLGGAILLVAGWVQAGTQYYLTDTLTGPSTSNWTEAGNTGPGPAGLAAQDANGGSLISRISVPDGTAEAEVRVTLALATSGGVYTEFLQASPNARTAGQGAGTFIAFEMQNPKFDDRGNCAANFVVLKSIGGVVSLVAAFEHACRNGMELRMALHGSVLLLWPDQAAPMELPVTALGSGQPGIGAYSTPPGNAISTVQLGLINRTAPLAVDAAGIGIVAFRNRTDVRWRAVAASAIGPGLSGYWIYRDGLYLMRTSTASFSDEAVVPGAKHTYTIYAVDQHYNFSPGSSVIVSTPLATPRTGAPPPAVAARQK